VRTLPGMALLPRLRSKPVPLPPQQLRFMGEDDARFISTGDTLIRELREHAGLGERDNVIDIGCGYGRVAHAMIRSRFRGRYRGFDILPKHVAWCSQNLGGKRYRFEHLDIRNDRYNPTGKQDPSGVELRLEPGWADVVLATSVFTHMWPDEVTNYLRQIPAGLSDGGQAYLTFFLLNDSWQDCLDAGIEQGYPLPHRGDGPFRYMNPDNPLHVIAYDQDWVEQQLAAAGLSVVSCRLGAWAGRESDTFQDVIVARRS
jgi:SAM-dependent methyltransferase